MKTEATDSNLARQFSMQSLLWMTTALAVLLAYARSLGAETLTQAVVYAVVGFMAGVFFGLATGKWSDGLFWSGLTTLLVFVAVAGGRLPNAGVGYGWAMVGAICGGMAGTRLPSHIWLGTALSAAAASLAIMFTVASLGYPWDGSIAFDVGCAAVVGGLLRPFIEFLMRLDAASQQPKVVLTAWLTISILIGNWLVPILAGVQR